MVRYPGRIFSLDDLINRVWNLDDLPTYDVVRSHVSSLRRKLADDQMIETLYGMESQSTCLGASNVATELITQCQGNTAFTSTAYAAKSSTRATNGKHTATGLI